MYWAQGLAAQTEDKELQAHFAPLAKTLTENEKSIAAELLAVQGNLNLGGTIVVANAQARPTGVFTIMTYGGTLSGSIGVSPLPGGMKTSVDLSEPGKVKVRVSAAGLVFSVN